MSATIPLLPPYNFMAWKKTNVPLPQVTSVLPWCIRLRPNAIRLASSKFKEAEGRVLKTVVAYLTYYLGDFTDSVDSSG